MDSRRRQTGQSLAETILLALLLAIIAGGVALLMGPGLDRVHSAVGDWWSRRVAPRFSASPAMTTVCADIDIVGSLTFRDLDADGQAETLGFGGPGNCSQVSAAGHPDDPLTSSASLGRLRCAAIDPLTLDLDYSESAAGVAFKPASPPSTLRLLDGAGGATLLSVDMAWDELLLSTVQGELTVAGLSAAQTDPRIDSPTLQAFDYAPACTISFSLPTTAGLLSFDPATNRLVLAARSVPFTARLSTCRR